MRRCKNILYFMLAVCLMTGCANKEDNANHSTVHDSIVADSGNSVADSELNTENVSESPRILIAYFSRYGNIDSEHEVDAISSASVLVKDGEMMGNMEYIARLIQQNVGGDLYFIETAEKYPSDYDNTDNNELDLQAEKEQRESARPMLASHVDDMEGYDTVFLCFPNWYSDMPMAVYSFLDEYDFSGKEIIVLTSSGGGRVGSISDIRELEPDAFVYDDEFTISHSRIESLGEKDIHDWLQEIGYL